MRWAAIVWVAGSIVLRAEDDGGEKQAAALRALAAESPRLPLVGSPFKAKPPRAGWELGMVSWVAVDRAGLIYLLQRGEKADPVIVLDRDGRVLRSWGRGLYTMPHAIRIDPAGAIWTTDAASSKVIKFSPDGKKLMEIAVGGQPVPCRNNFCGTTDVAFAPNGHVYISDGYANARVLEYTADGRKVREWGKPGTGEGEFRVVHSIQVDERGIVYVSDRENGRIQRFTLDGRFLGLWSNLGKTFSITLGPQCLYIGTQPRNLPNGSQGWLMKVDRESGRVLGVVESERNHGVAVAAGEELAVGPGANGPVWFGKQKGDAKELKQSQKLTLPGVIGTPNPVLIRELVLSSRILANEGVLDSYGHASVRDDRKASHFFLSRRRAASLVAATDVFEYDLDGQPVVQDQNAVHIWERFIHSEIYRLRPDVTAVVHCHAPDLVPFGVSTVPLKPIFHMAAFLGLQVPIFEPREKAGMTDLLIRTPELGRALAQALGGQDAALMRGHGAVVVGPSIRVVTGRAYYMNLNARLQAQALSMGGKVTYLDPEEARKAAPQDGYERAWEDWSHKITSAARAIE